MSEYDISRAFNRIENDLMDSMMRNLKRHQAEEDALGIKWEQWQVLQLKELERYRKENASKFTKDFAQINRRIDKLFRTTSKDAQSQEEAKILDIIKKGQFTPTERKDVRFFGVNDDKLNVLIERTRADFTKAEYAVLRKSNDAYRQIIFDAQVYGNVTNDYAKAVDMATHDYLMHGYQSIVYKNGARHNISDYARMAIRTGNKRAYLMGEGNARDEFGIHTIRVNKRTQACPKCVGFLGKVLIDDVYANGTRAEADELGVPTLSDAINAGFLHPNCKDIYSMYIPDVSRPAEPWTRTEIQQLVGRYNKEQEIERALDMAESYERMARYSLSPDNQTKYQARADQWQSRVNELRGEPITEQQVELPPIVEASQVHEFTKDEKEAIEWYVSGDGMWINQYLRGRGDFGELSDTEQQMLDLLKSATDRPLDPSITKLYRSVDASAIFGNLSDMERDNLYNVIVYGDSYVRDYKQQPLERKIKSTIGKTLEEKGFMSTTLDKDIAVNFGDFTDSQNPIVLELDTAKAKLKGADLQAWDIEDDPQKEILLHTGTKYKITDVGVGRYPEGGKYILVKAEAVDDVAEQAVANVAEQPKFVPAKTIQEAEQYAQKFTDASRFGAVGVSYDGVAVDVANIVNKTVGDFFNEYDVEAFGGIIAPKGNTKLGKLVDGATAGYSPVRHSFLLNRKALKDVKTAEKALKKEAEVVTDVLKNPNKYDMTKLSTRVRKVIEASAISGRGTVPQTVEEVLWHELGHSLEKKMSRLPNFNTIKANMNKYAPQISGYATDSLPEYIAESFCAYKKGEKVVDPELIKAFESLRR